MRAERLIIFTYTRRGPVFRPGLQVSFLEGVPSAQIARSESFIEPLLSLLRRPMGEAVRHDIALHALLNAVVTDCAGGIDRLVEVPSSSRFILFA